MTGLAESVNSLHVRDRSNGDQSGHSRMRMRRSNFAVDIKASSAQEADFTKLREVAAPAPKPTYRAAISHLSAAVVK